MATTNDSKSDKDDSKSSPVASVLIGGGILSVFAGIAILAATGKLKSRPTTYYPAPYYPPPYYPPPPPRPGVTFNL